MYGARHVSLVVLSLSLSVTYLNAASKVQVLTYPVAPFASQVDGVKQGFLIELVDAIFKQANMPYEVAFYPLKRAMAMVSQYENMCVLPVQRSQERESQFSWIGPVMISRYGLFSRSNKSISLQVLNDAKDLNIGSFLGSGISEYLHAANYKIEHTANNHLSLKQLERGYIDLWAVELMSAKSAMQAANLDLGKAELIFFTSIAAMVCHSDMSNDSQESLRGALKTLYQNGFIDSLNRKYGVRLD